MDHNENVSGAQREFWPSQLPSRFHLTHAGKVLEISVSEDQIEFRVLTPRAPPSSFTVHPSEKFPQLCAFTLKGYFSLPLIPA